MTGKGMIWAVSVSLLCVGATLAADVGTSGDAVQAASFLDKDNRVQPPTPFVRSDATLLEQPVEPSGKRPWLEQVISLEADAPGSGEGMGFSGGSEMGIRGGGCGDPTAGECCEPNWSPYCNDEDCCNFVCEDLGMYWCCGTQGWGYECAAAARDYCSCSAPTSACCIDGTTCVDLSYFDCSAVGGRWFSFANCGDPGFECTGCDADETLYSQNVSSGYPHIHSFGSDIEGAKVVDRFQNVQGDICGVKWYGKTGPSRPWDECEENPETFEILFYEDDGGRPGTVVCTYTVTVTGIPLDFFEYAGIKMYEYVAQFDTCCTLENGWVGITGMTADSPDCYFWWYASYEDDHSLCYWDSSIEDWFCTEQYDPWGYDANFCLLGNPYPGACCDDATGMCEDGVEAVDCPPTSRFTPGTLCDDEALEPECGSLAGACCIDEPPYCYIDSELSCTGTYLGHGTVCDTNDCNENGVPDTCDIASGSSTDCDGDTIPDECELAAGADDYNQNGVMDICEPDCNNNGLVDACDLDCTTGLCGSHPTVTCGQSQDCQQNGVPDECELGETGVPLLWDNGEPRDVYPASVWSQFGGYFYDRFVVDDFSLSADARINTVTWYVEEDEAFIWENRVRLDIYADNGSGGPNDFAQVVSMWVPTDGGAVARTPVGFGADLTYRYRMEVSGLDIPLGPGIWWIGLATDGVLLAPTMGGTPVGFSKWCASRLEGEWEQGIIVMGEAHVRTPSEEFELFEPISMRLIQDPYSGAAYDMSFTLKTTVHGADCNDNGIPDDCDIADCDGSAWCQDCQGNGIPDGCETDCNGNEIPDQCDILFCDGSSWCGDCDLNEVPDICQIPPLGEEPDCNENGIPDACDVAAGFDCNENGIPDECDIEGGTSTDYDENGVPDECDPDCNGNGIVDACDVDCTTGNCSAITNCGQSEDCQPDGIPDECQLALPITYLSDDGTHDISYGPPFDASVAWLNGFTVQDGAGTITEINIAWGEIPNGLPCTVYLWSDPDGNGNPADAHVLASAETTVADADTSTFITVDIPDTYVGPTGSSFFVGAIMDAQTGQYPAALDEEFSVFGTTWIVGRSTGPLDPNNLAGGDLSLSEFTLGVSWMIRAEGVLIQDCNGNGIPDDCDIASGVSTDCDSNGTPDECEWQDCNDNDVHDACDLSECDGSIWCSDCNANGIIDECDLLPGQSNDCQPDGIPDECQDDCDGNGTPDECDIRDCDGSPWCGDCNEDSILDACQLGGGGGGHVYQYDDGSVELALGYGAETMDMVWIQRFDAVPGNETIAAISTTFGVPGPLPGVIVGDDVSVYVWSDTFMGMFQFATWMSTTTTTIDAASLQTGVLQVIPIDPVTVSGSFFIGVGVTVEATGSPAPADMTSALTYQSWAAFTSPGTFNPANLLMDPNLQLIKMSEGWIPVNWVLRAVSAEQIPANDCNGNGIPDDCELCGDLDTDNDVDYDDYVLFRAAFGAAADGDPSYDYCVDYDNTGAVGLADYDAWLACYRDFIGDPLAGPPTPPDGDSLQSSVPSKKERRSTDRSRR